MDPRARDRSGPIVVLAGAGASDHLGFPVGSQFTGRVVAEIENAGCVERFLWDLCFAGRDLNFEEILEECDRLTDSLWSQSLLDTAGRTAAHRGFRSASALGRLIRREVVRAFGHLDGSRLTRSPWLRLLPALCQARMPGKRARPVRLFTTNYDTAMMRLEGRLRDAGVEVLSGFRPLEGSPTWTRDGLERAMRGEGGETTGAKVAYVQLHGGVTWERAEDGKVVEHVNRDKSPNEEIDWKALVWPAVHKDPYQDPFWAHHEHLVWSLQAAWAVLFVGYGFRDETVGALLRLSLRSRAARPPRIVLWDRDRGTYLRASKWIDLSRVVHVEKAFHPRAVPYVLEALGLPVPALPRVTDVPRRQRAIFERAIRVALDLPESEEILPDHLANVTDLHLADEPGFDDDGLRLLRKTPNLRRLNLDATKVSNTRLLARLGRLQRLYLAKTDVRDLGPFRDHLPAIWELGLGGAGVSDLSPLSGRDHLRVLNLEKTDVSDSQMVHLSALAGLVWLQLGGTQVSDVSHLSPLRRLRTLFLDDTHVSDLSPLKRLSGLRTLHLANAPVSDDQVAELQNALPNLEVVR